MFYFIYGTRWRKCFQTISVLVKILECLLRKVCAISHCGIYFINRIFFCVKSTGVLLYFWNFRLCVWKWRLGSSYQLKMASRGALLCVGIPSCLRLHVNCSVFVYSTKTLIWSRNDFLNGRRFRIYLKKKKQLVNCAPFRPLASTFVASFRFAEVDRK